MKIAITGVTGLLGRNLFYEILKQNLNNTNIKIFVFGRNQGSKSLKQRLIDEIKNDGRMYLGITTEQKLKNFFEHFEEVIRPVHFDLAKTDLGISNQDFEELKKQKIEKFFHLAALTDFRVTPLIKKKLDEVNVEGTKKVINLIGEIGVKHLIFSGSAYSAGMTSGIVMPDCANPMGKFRNYYEQTKLIAEDAIKEFSKESKINYQIFRLTGIGGRLIEQPIGHVSKYDIFYGWMMFFFKQRLSSLGEKFSNYNEPLEINVRIALNKKGGMNVAPADYAAKIMYLTSIFGNSNESYHIVNDIDIPNQRCVELMLEALNITGWQIVDDIPKEKNKIERFYYKSVGDIFTPYVMTDKIVYNIDNLESIRKKYKIECPPMTEDNFKKLLNFAKENNFGVKI